MIPGVALLPPSWSVRDSELEQSAYVLGKPSARSPCRAGSVEFDGHEPATRLKPLSHCTAKLLSYLGSGLENWLKVRFREFIHGGRSNRGDICGSAFVRQKSHLPKVISWSKPQPFFLRNIVWPRDGQHATADNEERLQH